MLARHALADRVDGREARDAERLAEVGLRLEAGAARAQEIRRRERRLAALLRDGGDDLGFERRHPVAELRARGLGPRQATRIAGLLLPAREDHVRAFRGEAGETRHELGAALLNRALARVD